MTTTENRFNLIDEPWIPIVDVGRVSLRQLFSHADYRALGGNPVQKIALTKLLLAIAQAAYTPMDDADWQALGTSGMVQKCRAYLDEWHERFYLYGDKPFLQMPAIKAAAVQNFGAVLPEVSSGNTIVLTQSQVEKALSDADKAVLVVQLMGFGLGGKGDNSIILSPDYQGKFNDKGNASVSLPGTSIGKSGYLHNFLQGDLLHETLWLNLFDRQQIADLGIYPQGVGTAPWERMPVGESCPVAESLKSSLTGRLVPLSQFCLLTGDGLHYSGGIAHPGYKEGVVDPSMSVDFSSDPKVIWVDPGKRPWRLLTALLGFLSATTSSSGFDCYQLRLNMRRARTHLKKVGIWSGGLKVSGGGTNKQFFGGSDDFVESLIQLNSSILGDTWFEQLKLEMTELDKLSKISYSATLDYFNSQKSEGKKQAGLASNLFWQLCERRFQSLVNSCDDADKVLSLRQVFAGFVHKAYDTYCPNNTARQLDAWAKNRPNLSQYLKNPPRRQHEC